MIVVVYWPLTWAILFSDVKIAHLQKTTRKQKKKNPVMWWRTHLSGQEPVDLEPTHTAESSVSPGRWGCWDRRLAEVEEGRGLTTVVKWQPTWIIRFLLELSLKTREQWFFQLDAIKSRIHSFRDLNTTSSFPQREIKSVMFWFPKRSEICRKTKYWTIRTAKITAEKIEKHFSYELLLTCSVLQNKHPKHITVPWSRLPLIPIYLLSWRERNDFSGWTMRLNNSHHQVGPRECEVR